MKTAVQQSFDPQETPESDGLAIELPDVSGSHRYMPALDGLRALAVGAVIAYHFNFHWANGGYLGVDFFFVLSGFLITSLLVGEWGETRHLALRSFWARRAKRLLPAVMVLLVVLSAYTFFGGPSIDAATFRWDEIATLFYYANWHLILTHQSYFALFQAPSPLKHTWSLAIEEQFYVFWPLILMVTFWLARRRVHTRGTFPRRTALILTAALAIVSAADMAILYRHGADPSRVYYGTDTRSFELFIGAVLAVLITERRDHSPRTRRLLHAIGPVAAVILAGLWVTAGDNRGNPSAWMYEGGLVVAGVLAAVVIASVAQSDSGPLGGILSVGPLRWIGRISYGLYLWHWPAYVLITDVTTGLTGPALLVARLAATVFAATTSYYLVERPVRRYSWRGSQFVITTVVAVAVTVVVVVAGTGAASRTTGGSLAAAAVKLPSPGSHPVPLQSSIALPAGQVVSPNHPLRVMTIGDSVMYDAELGIAASLESTGEVTVSTHGYPGWGLRNDPNYEHDLTALIQQDHPQLIIAMWSWDNAYAVAHPIAYAALINRAVQAMLAPQNGVDGIAFLQFPLVGPLDGIVDPVVRAQTVVGQNAGTQRWSTIVSALPAHYPGKVAFLRTASSLEFRGRYSAWLPTASGGWVRVRKIDNTHLCPAGAAVLGAAVTQQLAPMFGLVPPGPGWTTGSWSRDAARYDDPHGSCPNDQPA